MPSHESSSLPPEKICRTCHVSKNLDEFGSDNRLRNGKRTQCKACRSIAEKRWRDARLDSARAYHNAYHRTHRIEMRAYSKKHYSTHSDELATKQKARYDANPQKVLAACQRRRARKKHAPFNDLTHAQWVEIQESQKHCCYYCGKRRKGRLTQDHLTALSQGGSHTLQNVIAACRSCNSKKGTGPPPIPVQPLLLTIAPVRKPCPEIMDGVSLSPIEQRAQALAG